MFVSTLHRLQYYVVSVGITTIKLEISFRHYRREYYIVFYNNNKVLNHRITLGILGSTCAISVYLGYTPSFLIIKSVSGDVMSAPPRYPHGGHASRRFARIREKRNPRGRNSQNLRPRKSLCGAFELVQNHRDNRRRPGLPGFGRAASERPSRTHMADLGMEP